MQHDDLDTGEDILAAPLGEVIPLRRKPQSGTKAGTTDDLKGLHAELTRVYRDYLDQVQVKPDALNPAMLAQIQSFLKQNRIEAEAPAADETSALQKRLEMRATRREALQQKIGDPLGD